MTHKRHKASIYTPKDARFPTQDNSILYGEMKLIAFILWSLGSCTALSFKQQGITNIHNVKDRVSRERHLFWRSKFLGDLSEVLSPLLPDLAYVYVDDNVLTEIVFSQFERLRLLSSLSATSNLIERVLSNGAKNVTLEKLLLSKNRITTIESTTFDGLPNLKILDLSHNSLKSIPPNFLSKNDKLERLSLSNNGLMDIPVTLFSNKEMLYRFYADGNQLRWNSVSMILCLRSIAAVKLNGNPLFGANDGFKMQCSWDATQESNRSMPGGIYSSDAALHFFGSTVAGNEAPLINLASTGLKEINFEGTALHKNAKYVQKMSFNENPIRKLTSHSFQGFYNLVRLYLENCQIRTIENNTFGEAEYLEILRLNGNPIIDFEFIKLITYKAQMDISGTDIPLDRLSSGPIEIAGLKANRIRSLPSNLSRVFRTVQELSLSEARLKGIRLSNYCKIGQLKHLNLSRNGKLKFVRNEKLDSSCPIVTIDMSHNNMSDLPVDFVRIMVKLKELSLSHCQFREARFSKFCRLKALKNLDLSNNHIDSIVPVKAGSECAIQQINLTGNKIRKVYNSLGLVHVQKLFLGYNKIVKICLNCIFDEMPQLLEFNLAGNPVTKIKDGDSMLSRDSVEHNVMRILHVAYWRLDDDLRCLSRFRKLKVLHVDASNSPIRNSLCPTKAAGSGQFDHLYELTLRGASSFFDKETSVRMPELFKCTVTEGNLRKINLDTFWWMSPNVRKVFMRGNGICKVAASKWTKNLHLSHLDLSDNPIKDLNYHKYLHTYEYKLLLPVPPEGGKQAFPRSPKRKVLKKQHLSRRQ